MRIEVVNVLPTKPIVAPIIEAETLDDFIAKVEAAGGTIILPKFKNLRA